MGVGTLERLEGVFTAEGRGLFLERGRDEGAERKSSGMSFHCSVVLGMGVVLEGTRFSGMRGGAEMDLGGGGGRFGAAEACGGGGGGGGGRGGCGFSLLAAGFFSQPESEDWSMFAGVRVVQDAIRVQQCGSAMEVTGTKAVCLYTSTPTSIAVTRAA